MPLKKKVKKAKKRPNNGKEVLLYTVIVLAICTILVLTTSSDFFGNIQAKKSGRRKKSRSASRKVKPLSVKPSTRHQQQFHAAEQLQDDDGKVCLAPPESIDGDACEAKHSKVGRADPENIAKTTVYQDWINGSIVVDGETLPVASGKITWPLPLGRVTNFSVIPRLSPAKRIDKVLKVLREYNTFDDDFDSVDAMPTWEIFVHEGDVPGAGKTKPGLYDNKKRQKIRKKVRRLLQPIEDKITAIIRQTWPDECARGGGRDCRPCSSLIRRYLPNERRGHNIHRDGQAIFTSVMSFTDYGKDFLGGLYVAANGVGRQVIGLRKGDVVFHRYDLLHGVQVDDFDDKQSERWSWILWFKDSDKCEQRGYEWSQNCAEEGDALCQYLHGWQVHHNPKLSNPQQHQQRKKWMSAAGHQGFGEASFKVGRSFFVYQNLTGAIWWLQQARLAGEADASYQLGHILLNGLIAPSCIAPGESLGEAVQIEALGLFEEAALAGASPFSGSQFAMYNIGVAYLYGFAGRERDPIMAARWFNEARIPEAYMAYSMYLGSVGQKKQAEELQAQAKRMGFPRDPRVRDKQLFGLHSGWPPGPPAW